MSITVIKNLGFIVTLPDNNMRMDDLFTDEMNKIDPRAVVEAVDRSHTAPSSYLVVSKLINKASIEKCLKVLPSLTEERCLSVKRNYQKEKKESQKLLKKLKKLPASKKFPTLVSAINDIVNDARMSYAEGEYGAVSNDLFDYDYLLTIYKLLKAGFLAEAYHPIKNCLILWMDPKYFPLPEETRKAIEAAYEKKYHPVFA
jgi:hypothetical protein